MQAEVKYFHSADVDDLAGFVPADPQDFGFSLQVIVGPAGAEGEESFETIVCTPLWMHHRPGPPTPPFERHTLVVNSYDWPAIERHIHDVVASAAADDWSSIAEQLHQELGHWEFHEYKP